VLGKLVQPAAKRIDVDQENRPQRANEPSPRSVLARIDVTEVRPQNCGQFDAADPDRHVGPPHPESPRRTL